MHKSGKYNSPDRATGRIALLRSFFLHARIAKDITECEVCIPALWTALTNSVAAS